MQLSLFWSRKQAVVNLLQLDTSLGIHGMGQCWSSAGLKEPNELISVWDDRQMCVKLYVTVTFGNTDNISCQNSTSP